MISFVQLNTDSLFDGNLYSFIKYLLSVLFCR